MASQWIIHLQDSQGNRSELHVLSHPLTWQKPYDENEGRPYVITDKNYVEIFTPGWIDGGWCKTQYIPWHQVFSVEYATDYEED